MRLEFDDGLNVTHALQTTPDPFAAMASAMHQAMGRGADLGKARFVVDNEMWTHLCYIADAGMNILIKPESDEKIRNEYRGVPIEIEDRPPMIMPHRSAY
jgi:hypothetical protein